MAFEGLTDRLQKAMEKLRRKLKLRKPICAKPCVRFAWHFWKPTLTLL